MTPQRFRKAYQTQQYEGMSREQLVLALLDASLRATERARDAIAASLIAARGEAISKALAIVGELQGSLDVERGAELAQNLFALYDYAQRELVQGNLRADPEPIRNAERVLTEIRDGWAAMLEDQARQSEADAPATDTGGVAEYA